MVNPGVNPGVNPPETLTANPAGSLTATPARAPAPAHTFFPSLPPARLPWQRSQPGHDFPKRCVWGDGAPMQLAAVKEAVGLAVTVGGGWARIHLRATGHGVSRPATPPLAARHHWMEKAALKAASPGVKVNPAITIATRGWGATSGCRINVKPWNRNPWNLYRPPTFACRRHPMPRPHRTHSPPGQISI